MRTIVKNIQQFRYLRESNLQEKLVLPLKKMGFVVDPVIDPGAYDENPYFVEEGYRNATEK